MGDLSNTYTELSVRNIRGLGASGCPPTIFGRGWSHKQTNDRSWCAMRNQVTRLCIRRAVNLQCVSKICPIIS